jgi:predicted SpoU family rRNA methylase
MAESGLGGRFWFKAASAGKDARNDTFKERIGMTLHQAMYGEKRNVSDFRAFG